MQQHEGNNRAFPATGTGPGSDGQHDLMRCGARIPRDCVYDHVRPYLREPQEKRSGDGFRALATCHPDTKHSLSVGVVGNRVSWHCFAGCSSDRARNALILLGVPAACLIRPAADVSADQDAIRAIVGSKATHAHRVLLIAAVLEGYTELPAGYALEELAQSCGVSVREAYKARRTGLRP